MFRHLLTLFTLCMLFSCSTSDNIETNYSSLDDIKLYNKAMSQLKKKKFDEAIETFSELEIQYPYSPWASRGQLLTGFVHYTANEYDEAILSLSKFIELNPNHPMIPYAIYLKAYSYFERIPDINLDQKLK